MAIKLVASLDTLFQRAHTVGKARTAYKKDPSPKNKETLDKAIEEKECYEKICLKADEVFSPSLAKILRESRV